MISAIILTWNSSHFIERCLQSLILDARNSGIDLEIYVVDGGSKDGTIEILARLSKEIPRLRLIFLGENLGTTMTRNMAIRKSQGEFILILDSDTVILPGALDTLFQTIKKTPRAGIVAPRLFYPDGTVQPSCKRFPTAFVKFFKYMPFVCFKRLGERAELYPPKFYAKSFEKILRVEHCISACWLVRREALESVGLLDENIFYAPEDVDYCLQMWLSGWEVLYVPFARVLHYTQRSSYKSFRMAWLHGKGLVYFFRKHRYLFSRKNLYKKIIRAVKQHGIQPPKGLN